MGLVGYPQASPLPTTPPHPRDVNRRLLAARQADIETCAFINAESTSALTCDIGEMCIHNTIYSDYFCCGSARFAEKECGIGPTTCVDSTAVPADCSGLCLDNPANVICTDGTNSYCQLTTFNLYGGLTAWGCGPEPMVLTAYDYFTDSSGQQNSVTVLPGTYGLTNPNSTLPNVIPSHTASSSASSSLVNPTPASVLPTQTAAPASTLSSGAKAGIAVGAIAAVAIIAALIAFIFIQKRRNDERRRQNQPSHFNQNQPSMVQQQPQHPPPQQQPTIPTSPALTQQNHLSMYSMPSATSTTPLTQDNMAAMAHSPPPPSEVLPSDSASQIIGPGGGSVLSSPGSPTGNHPTAGSSSNAPSQEHSGLGPLPNYPTGFSAFPHGQQRGGQSVLSTPSAFMSAPPVHAPSVAPYGGGQT